MARYNRYFHVATSNNLSGVIGDGYFSEIPGAYRSGCKLKRVDINLGANAVAKNYTIEIVGPAGDALISTLSATTTSQWVIYTPPSDGSIEIHGDEIIRVITTGVTNTATVAIHVESR
jgi:hypothetical protein